MTANDTLSHPPIPNSQSPIRLLVATVLGAALGYGSIRLLVKLHVPVKAMAWPDLLAVVVGLLFLVSGVVTIAISLNRKQLAGVMESEDKSTPATAEEARSYRLQGSSLLLAGVMLLLPVSAQGSSQPRAMAIFAAIAILFALQSVINLRVWRSCDEFGRQLILQTCGVTFGLGQAALFLWAAAGHLRLVHPIDSWACINLLMVLYLSVSIAASLRYRR